MSTIKVNRGADRSIPFDFVEADGVTPYDLTGYTPVILDASEALQGKLDVLLSDATGGVVIVALDQTAGEIMTGKYGLRVQVNKGEVSLSSGEVTVYVL